MWLYDYWPQRHEERRKNVLFKFLVGWNGIVLIMGGALITVLGTYGSVSRDGAWTASASKADFGLDTLPDQEHHRYICRSRTRRLFVCRYVWTSSGRRSYACADTR